MEVYDEDTLNEFELQFFQLCYSLTHFYFQVVYTSNKFKHGFTDHLISCGIVLVLIRWIPILTVVASICGSVIVVCCTSDVWKMEIYDEDTLNEFELQRQKNIIKNYEFMKVICFIVTSLLLSEILKFW